MSVTLIRGNALALPLPDASVDLAVTSPPYFGLRSYQDGGDHYAGQIGAEPTPAEFVDALIAATREMVRVLKPSGSMFVNLGDKYVSDNRGSGGDAKRGPGKWAPAGHAGYVGEGLIPRKSLMDLPHRYSIRCVDELGLIKRAEIIWSKPNGLPESVTDRVRRSHETWFHFTKEPRYYSAVDEIREPHPAGRKLRDASRDNRVYGRSMSGYLNSPPNPFGKLPGSVWSISTQPLTVPAALGVDHFAAFPMEWPRRIIRGWSPAGVCTACGEGRRPVTSALPPEQNAARAILATGQRTKGPITCGVDKVALGVPAADRQRTVIGYAYACACPDTNAPTTPGVVLDPFGGTGTTALVADVLGRHGISVDMSADYLRLARWRTTDPGQRAAAMQVEKPAAVMAGQCDLFGGVA